MFSSFPSVVSERNQRRLLSARLETERAERERLAKNYLIRQEEARVERERVAKTDRIRKEEARLESQGTCS